jgi:hypothetical protein
MIVNPGLTRGGGGAGLILSLTPAAWFRYGVGITVTGQGVSQWDDQSGNARHLKQGTDGARPTLNADGSILFNGSDEFLKCDAFTLNQPETVYILFKQVTWTGGDYVYDGNGSNGMAVYQTTATPNLYQFAGGAVNANAITTLAVDTYGVLASVFNGASSLNQLNNDSPVSGEDVGANNAGGFTLGSNGAGNGGWSNIQVKEAILYSAAHDATTRARVISYLARVGNLGL